MFSHTLAGGDFVPLQQVMIHCPFLAGFLQAREVP